MILHETAQFIVVDKPRGWLTIPGRDPGSHQPVLIDKLRERFPELWIVHRLDVVTSGVIIFARNEAFHKSAQEWFRRRQVDKEYRAIACGTPTTPAFRCNEPIDEKVSETFFKVLARGPHFFLVSAKPKTGRLHQIRKHLSSLGYPILGDVTYGGSALPQSSGIALHSYSMKLPELSPFTAALPEDFLTWIKEAKIKP
ncbi:MAG: RNA pseudouridine synthase [Xanthomonadaceae bacterium]|nr:RNA pseudouridine synthase [Xanthomonadaceae bacterium]